VLLKIATVEKRCKEPIQVASVMSAFDTVGTARFIVSRTK
jgi:hypothetical protein